MAIQYKIEINYFLIGFSIGEENVINSTNLSINNIKCIDY